MSEHPKRKKPSELALVASTEAGEVLEATPEPTPREAYLAKLRANLYTGADLLERVRPQEWLVKDWIPRDGVTAIVAPPKKGKSFYALSLALEVARGGSWAGEKLEKATVLYVAAERYKLQRDRYEAWLEKHQEERLDTFVMVGLSPQLTSASQVEALCDLIEELEPDLVVLDTFARMLLGVEENSAKEIGPAMEALSDLVRATRGGAVVVVHHTGKDTSKGARGSSAFLAALDVLITLDGDPKALRARVTDSNAGAEPMPEWYKLEEVVLPELTPGGQRRISVALVPTMAREAGSELDEVVLEILTSHGELSNAQLREALEEETGLPRSQTTVSKVLRRLVDSGKVTSSGGGRPRYSKATTYPARS